MSRGRREQISEGKLNIKKVIFVIVLFLLIVLITISFIYKDKIINLIKPKEEISIEKEEVEKEKTIDELALEFGGEIIEKPKKDTFFISKEDKIYTLYADGEIVEEKVSFWNGQSSKPAIDEAGNYNIYTAEELKWIADQVISGEENFAGVTITLRKNLDMGARIKEDNTWEGPVWTSVVGFLDELPEKDKKTSDKKKEKEDDDGKEKLKRFAGTFNGNECTIRGIYIDADKNYQGLFGYSTGTVENLILKNSYISGNDATGSIVGLNGGMVRNCATIDTLVVGKTSKTGGIVGNNMSNATITQSYTERGVVLGKEYVGGIVVYTNNNAIITECTNTAEVVGESYTGGISGIAFFGTTIQNIDNSGKIKSKNYTGGIIGFSEAQIEKAINRGEILGEDFVGGLVGVNFTMGNVSKSYNSGSVEGNNNVGGIVGTNNAATSNCYNKGKIVANGYRAGGICGQNATGSTIYNCYNIEKVEGNTIGGVVGGDFGTTTNCYYLDTIFENITSEQSKTEEDMKNNILQNLGEEFAQDINNFNEGYPILGWQI